MNLADSTNHDLKHILQEIIEILPTQGPIDVFIHHNTLHAFEHLPFDQAVIQAAGVYGAEAFLPEQRYLDEYRNGRITRQDLETVLAHEVQDQAGVSTFSLRHLIKQFLVVSPPVEGFQQVKWLLRESTSHITPQAIPAEKLIHWLKTHGACVDRRDALHKINFEAAEGLEAILKEIPRTEVVTQSEQVVLWASCLLTAAEVWESDPGPAERDEDLVCDDLINPLLIRFCEEYLDLGFSNQLMPDREEGMLACFLRLVDSAQFGIPKWLQPIRKDLNDYKGTLQSPEVLVSRVLTDLNISSTQAHHFLQREALSLRGWAGYIALVEKRPDMLHGQEGEIVPRFVEYIGVRLLLRKYALRSSLYRSKIADLLEAPPELRTLDGLYCFAYHTLSLFTSLGIGDLLLDEPALVRTTLEVLKKYDQVQRRRIWHLAYENNLYARTLDALSSSTEVIRTPHKAPQAQFIFCIDDREESMRRHLEARNGEYQTFGTAGFFGVDANLTNMRGASAPYCPVIIQPKHAIREVPKEGFEDDLTSYRRKQAAWFRVSGYMNRGSGSIAHNLILSLAGCVSLIPMLLGVVAPRVLRFFGKLFGSEPTLPADLHELQIAAQPEHEGSQSGYTLEEMAVRVANVLRGIGLVDNFAHIVMLVGHGSSSRNNPLRSAYDCGACGGRPGRINARAFCLMANDPDVRAIVAERTGIRIPIQTYFVGGFHNTCSDQVEYFDLDRVPALLTPLLNSVQHDLREAAKQNAFERCRRFVLSGITDPDQAAEEALARSYMLAEARPEYGHATNAICIVGPRDYSKEIFLDRRSFLVSYDHKIDSDSQILLGILRAVVPVCGGINLEYLFSAMDNEVYGAGTKLPHNIVSLVGIMNGTSSDLRTGLPTQMVEIHEPVRLLLVVVATREQLEKVISSEPMIQRSFDGEWIKVVLRNSVTGALEWRLPKGEYSPYLRTAAPLPHISSYREWLTGKAGHLPFASIPRQEVHAP